MTQGPCDLTTEESFLRIQRWVKDHEKLLLETPFWRVYWRAIHDDDWTLAHRMLVSYLKGELTGRKGRPNDLDLLQVCVIVSYLRCLVTIDGLPSPYIPWPWDRVRALARQMVGRPDAPFVWASFADDWRKGRCALGRFLAEQPLIVEAPTKDVWAALGVFLKSLVPRVRASAAPFERPGSKQKSP